MIRGLGAAIVMMVLAMSCFVDRRSGDFECDDDSDCTEFTNPSRSCDGGYCVPATCPAICDGGCGAGKTCTIRCTSPNECRNGISCPSGYTCDFDCEENCTPVNCPLGCTVDCGVGANCGPVNCGSGATCSCSGAGTCM